MKYKVGDKVRIKSIDWYNENKDEDGYIYYGTYMFFPCMSQFCGKTFEIAEVHSNCYNVKEVYAKTFEWTDEMIEGLVEEPVLSAPNITECVFIHEKDMKCKTEYILPDGYIFKDENGNVINATKIVLEKKNKEYPKTYFECSNILSVYTDPDIDGYKGELLWTFQKLLICRDAYWKIAGEEMGLGKPWEPDYDSGVDKFGIICLDGVVQESNPTTNWERHLNKILDFPTREMRTAFKENFNPDIEICKEFL